MRHPEIWLYIGALDTWRGILCNSITLAYEEPSVEKQQQLLDGLCTLNEACREEMVRATLASC